MIERLKAGEVILGDGSYTVTLEKRGYVLANAWTSESSVEHPEAVRHSIYVRIVDQSICTLISNLSGRPDIFLGSGTLKKLGPKYGVQKAGCKKQGHCYLKKEETRLSFLFLNNNDPVFCTQLFAPYILDPIF